MQNTLAGLYLGKLALEHLKCIHDYTNRQVHSKLMRMLLIVIKTATFPFTLAQPLGWYNCNFEMMDTNFIKYFKVSKNLHPR